MAALAGILRRIRHSSAARGVVSWIGAQYIRLVNRTTRWHVVGEENFARLSSSKNGLIAVLWHGRLFMSPTFAPEGRRTVAMISNNRDGDLIAAIVWRFGVFSIRGSTYDRNKRRDKGGALALQAGAREVGKGAVLAITPDGPRGPRMRAQTGAAQIAIEQGVSVIPVAFSTVRGKVANNWDRFLIPAPFGRGVIVFGPEMPPPQSSGPGAVARFTAEIEVALTAVTNQADDLCGRKRIQPGPVEPAPHEVAETGAEE